MRNVLKLFVREFLANNIIPCIPVIWVRLFFYRFFLHINIGLNSNILMDVYMYNGNNIFTIGSNTTINRGCILDRRGGLIIGSHVSISPRVQIYTAGHDINSDTFDSFLKPVIIEDYVWIGSNVVIQPGVVIRKGAVILSGSVVAKSVENNQIVGGNPARLISCRKVVTFSEHYKSSWSPWFT
jgi:maltose O-acetyltransferase